MATYKVIQDIEAEDKLVGPFSMRQFLYAGIVVVSGFIAFKLMFVAWWLVIPFLPHMILFSVLAAPFGRDQPSEIWLLAKIRFFLKPRRRIWDQSGVKELVTITVPKRVERNLTKNLSQTEVKSRLQALANTIDSRGWAVKNVNVNLFAQPSYVLGQASSDRLIDPSTIAQDVPNYDVSDVDDMMDERSNPTAQYLDQMITATAQQRRQQAIAQMQQGGSQNQPQPDYWFMNATNGQPPAAPPGYATFDHNPLVTPNAPGRQGAAAPPAADDIDETAVLRKLKAEKQRPDPMHSRLKKILPLSEQQKLAKQKKKAKSQAPAAPPAASRHDPAILQLASNDDLNVATLARQAEKARKNDPPDEVVISLR